MLKTGPYSFADERPLPLSDGSDDLEQQLAMGERSVYSLGTGNKANAELPEQFECAEELPQGSGETIELPDDNDVNLSTSAVCQQSIECWASFFASRDSFICIDPGFSSIPGPLEPWLRRPV